MLATLIAATAFLLLICLLLAWRAFQDVFHPAVLMAPMLGFMYVYMPLQLIVDDQLFSYVSEEQAVFAQTIILLAVAALMLGCFLGSRTEPGPRWLRSVEFDPEAIRRGGYLVGAVGLAAWIFAVQNAGGIGNVFGRAKGYGWSEWGFIREAAYLMIVGLLLLLSPQGFLPRDAKWRAAVVLLAIPYLMQGLLGAQRGPTFLVTVTIGMSWYLARSRRPPLWLLLSGGAGLCFLMLFLAMNRGQIYLGSDFDVDTDKVDQFFTASAANEYIFGAGCITASHHTGDYFWGKRYLAQILVRPIPRQIWPEKYVDFGVPEIELNAGVAKTGLEAVMGWSEIPGAAAGMVADVWVEFSWLAIPFLGLVGWSYGYVWKRAAVQGGPWITLFTILALLSVYFISQSGEAVIFRLLILTTFSMLVWRRAAGRSRSVSPVWVSDPSVAR